MKSTNFLVTRMNKFYKFPSAMYSGPVKSPHVLKKKQTGGSLRSGVKNWAFPPRLAVPDLTFDLILVWGHFPVWSAFSCATQSRGNRHQRHIWCDSLQNGPCALYAWQTMQLRPNCSTEIPTTVVDPDKAAFNMNQLCQVQTGDRSCLKSGGANLTQ